MSKENSNNDYIARISLRHVTGVNGCMRSGSGISVVAMLLRSMIPLLVIGLTAVGCAAGGESEPEGSASVPRDMNPIVGRLGPATFGDDRRSVERALGRGRVRKHDPIRPTEVDLSSSTVPPRFEYPRGRWPGEEPIFIRYPSVTAVLVHDRLYLVVVTARGTNAGRDLEMGDSLDDAKRAYPTLTCSRATGLHGDDLFPYCTGRVAEGRFLWAGGDPITSLAISRGAMSG